MHIRGHTYMFKKRSKLLSLVNGVCVFVCVCDRIKHLSLWILTSLLSPSYKGTDNYITYFMKTALKLVAKKLCLVTDI